MVVVDALTVEREPTGAAILTGVLAEAASARVAADAVTGSTEDNLPTVATGIGVTVIVHEALPIGSGGVTSELHQLAASAGLTHAVLPEWPVAPDQTGGPSTAALLAVDGRGSATDACATVAAATTGLPVWAIATLTTDPVRSSTTS